MSKFDNENSAVEKDVKIWQLKIEQRSGVLEKTNGRNYIMTQEVQIFNFEEKQVRTIEIDNEPWFVGKDIAQILGYTNPRKALRDHVDEEDSRGERIVTPSGTQMAKVINESGLYSLILSSKLPTAKKFKRWVTSEVLPTITQYNEADYIAGEMEAIEAREILLQAKEKSEVKE